jgi:hypothetical protein
MWAGNMGEDGSTRLGSSCHGGADEPSQGTAALRRASSTEVGDLVRRWKGRTDRMMRARLVRVCYMEGAVCDTSVTCMGYTGRQIDRRRDRESTPNRAEEVQTCPRIAKRP